MPFSECNLMMALSNDAAFAAALLKALDEIKAAVLASGGGGGGGGSPNTFSAITWLPLSAIDTSVTDITGGAYTTLITDAHEKKYVQIYNRSIEDILVSFGSGADHHIVGAGSSLTLVPGQDFGTIDGNVSIKSLVGGGGLGSGYIYGAAYY